MMKCIYTVFSLFIFVNNVKRLKDYLHCDYFFIPVYEHSSKNIQVDAQYLLDYNLIG